MKESKNNNTLVISILIVLVIIFIIGATYAYFSLNITGDGNKNEINAFDENMEITFTDTSNVSLINAYTGDNVIKTFTVENTGSSEIYYDIKLSNLTNDFVNFEDLVYTLSSDNNGAVVSQTVVPTKTDSFLASTIKIEPGVIHNYTLEITFLRTDEDQSLNENKTFSAKISIAPTSDTVAGGRMYRDNTLGYALLNNNIILSESNIDFSNASQIDGLYYTNSSIDNSTVYFFRGSQNLNNNLIFAGKCWKIIRITEDSGIRIIYDDTKIINNNECVEQSEDVSVSSAFNTNNTSNAHVGLKYGEPGSSNYENEHSNVTPSTIKDALDNWYQTNISTYSAYIEDSYYCNNRKTSKFTIDSVIYNKLGYSNNNTGYASKKNLLDNRPSYNCYNSNDIFTVTNEKGNQSLTSPIALLTTDEALFAGLLSTGNSNNFLTNGKNYWTMSPAYYNGTNAYNSYISDNGSILESVVSTEYNLRPVITLKQDTILISGNGSLVTPYKIN